MHFFFKDLNFSLVIYLFQIWHYFTWWPTWLATTSVLLPASTQDGADRVRASHLPNTYNRPLHCCVVNIPGKEVRIGGFVNETLHWFHYGEIPWVTLRSAETRPICNDLSVTLSKSSWLPKWIVSFAAGLRDVTERSPESRSVAWHPERRLQRRLPSGRRVMFPKKVTHSDINLLQQGLTSLRESGVSWCKPYLIELLNVF